MYSLIFLLAMAAVVIGIQFAMRFWRMRRLTHWFKRGTEAFAAERFEEALPAFRKCVGIAPEWLHTRTLLAMCLAQTGEQQAALKEIMLVEQLQPRHGETWALISLFYAMVMPDKQEHLLQALQTLYELEPQVAAKLIHKPQFQRFDAEPFQELFRRIKEWEAQHDKETPDGSGQPE